MNVVPPPPVVAKSDVQAFQSRLRAGLTTVFAGCPVEIEWAAMTDEPGVYSPRLDAAVGPFATQGVYGGEYDALVKKHATFLEGLFTAHTENIRALNKSPDEFEWEDISSRNWNARCFLAVEVENAVSRKHLMGGAINAAALGRIGVAVGWDEGKVNALVRLRSYLLFLARVGKNTFNPTNLLIVSAQQLEALLPAVCK